MLSIGLTLFKVDLFTPLGKVIKVRIILSQFCHDFRQTCLCSNNTSKPVKQEMFEVPLPTNLKASRVEERWNIRVQSYL